MSVRRRQYIINRRFQLRYTVIFVGLALACLVLSAAAMLQEITGQIDAYIANPSAEISSTGDLMLPVVFRVSATFSVTMLAIIALMSLLYYRRASRIAKGLDEKLKRFAGGELDFRMEVEKSDDFREMEDAFNLMLSENSARISALQRAAAEIERDVETLRTAVEDGKGAGLELSGLRKRITEAEGVLSSFRLR